jgi:hypothetical protein
MTANPNIASLWASKADIDRLCEQVNRLASLIEQRLPAPVPSREWLSIKQASEATGRSPQAIRRWCRVFKIGTRGPRGWMIDRDHLAAHLGSGVRRR